MMQYLLSHSTCVNVYLLPEEVTRRAAVHGIFLAKVGRPIVFIIDKSMDFYGEKGDLRLRLKNFNQQI